MNTNVYPPVAADPCPLCGDPIPISNIVYSDKCVPCMNIEVRDVLEERRLLKLQLVDIMKDLTSARERLEQWHHQNEDCLARARAVTRPLAQVVDAEFEATLDSGAEMLPGESASEEGEEDEAEEEEEGSDWSGESGIDVETDVTGQGDEQDSTMGEEPTPRTPQ